MSEFFVGFVAAFTVAFFVYATRQPVPAFAVGEWS